MQTLRTQLLSLYMSAAHLFLGFLFRLWNSPRVDIRGCLGKKRSGQPMGGSGLSFCTISMCIIETNRFRTGSSLTMSTGTLITLEEQVLSI